MLSARRFSVPKLIGSGRNTIPGTDSEGKHSDDSGNEDTHQYRSIQSKKRQTGTNETSKRRSSLRSQMVTTDAHGQLSRVDSAGIINEDLLVITAKRPGKVGFSSVRTLDEVPGLLGLDQAQFSVIEQAFVRMIQNEQIFGRLKMPRGKLSQGDQAAVCEVVGRYLPTGRHDIMDHLLSPESKGAAGWTLYQYTMPDCKGGIQ